MAFLFKDILIEKTISDFPQTRFQGSKYKLLKWIWDSVSFLDFDQTADIFGGTASVSYLFKTKGKRVIYNDILMSNYYTGVALIENGDTKLTRSDIGKVLNGKVDNPQETISTIFKDIYYTDSENHWLDKVIQNIYQYFNDNLHKKAMLLWCLFQCCIIKRPYNLFHRKNLYIRTNNVKRTFGNKTTWDKPFDYYFRKFTEEINNAVFDNGKTCVSHQKDVLELENNHDLVYIDPPYISNKGVGVDYFHFYHFLEGICHYYQWEQMIDYSKKHRPLKSKPNRWIDKKLISKAFYDVISHFRNSHIVISYRSDGIPSVEELVQMIKNFKKNYKLMEFGHYKYVLSTNGASKEILLIGWD